MVGDGGTASQMDARNAKERNSRCPIAPTAKCRIVSCWHLAAKVPAVGTSPADRAVARPPTPGIGRQSQNLSHGCISLPRESFLPAEVKSIPRAEKRLYRRFAC